MTFDPTRGLYPQYKKDTNLVAQWLDATSKAHGFIRPTGSQQQAGARNQYIICIADFVHMAEFISVKGHVSIPTYVSSCLSRAVRYRSTYGSYLQRQRYATTIRDETEHKKHMFFIDVLKKVQGILNSISKPDTPAVRTTQSHPTGTRFASLHIPQPATVEDDVDNHEPTPIRTKVSPEPPEDDVLFEPWKEDDEEALFQWRLFNMDVQRIRKQIRQLWELYRDGQLSLTGVATAHNMAIHVIRKLEQDIDPVLEKWGGYVNLTTSSFVRRYLGKTSDVGETRTRLSRFHVEEGGKIIGLTVDAIIDGFDIAEEEMVFAWQVLLSETWAWNRCGSFGCYNGKWGPFIPRDDRQNMTNLDKYNRDKAVACGIVHDLQVLVIYLNPSVGMVLDELSAAIEGLVPWRLPDMRKHMSKQYTSTNDKITFRAVFAVQLLLDSTHVLGTSVNRPCRELLDKTARIFKSVKSLREFYQGPGALALGPLPGPSFVENIEKASKFWQDGDPIAAFRRIQGAPNTNTPIEKIGTLLQHNSPLCGWWIQTVQATYYSHSIMVANSISLPLACARLYSVFVQERLVPEGSWPDMDAFIILHRKELWVGAAPNKSDQYLQKLLLVEGNSVVNLASDARLGPPAMRPQRVKCLAHSAKVSEKIFDAFVSRKVEGLSEEDLERLMTDTKVRWYNGKAVRPCFHHGWEKAGNNKGDTKPTSSKTDNPFLRLSQAIDAETLEQSFDYMSLNRVCWMVLRELMKKGRPILDADSSHSRKPRWEGAEGEKARAIVAFIFFALFPADGTVYPKEASAIADILLNLMKAIGRVVHTATGIDWAQELKCNCANIPS
ncbi:hypothetical protein F4803DRAFT_511033 [Xylaria telfairii]|nr:hypothetical protein F4803DRAFT_511033 [Xylaria telfairii]